MCLCFKVVLNFFEQVYFTVVLNQIKPQPLTHILPIFHGSTILLLYNVYKSIICCCFMYCLQKHYLYHSAVLSHTKASHPIIAHLPLLCETAVYVTSTKALHVLLLSNQTKVPPSHQVIAYLPLC